MWLGTHALDIGAITPLFYTFRDREEVLKIFEKYCGARLTTHAFRIGGLQYETYTGFEKEVKNFLDFFRPKIDEYEELLTTNRIWVERTKNVGPISAEDCIALGVTGPVLRASGVKWDLRKAQPYANYKNFDFEIPIRTKTATLTTGIWCAWPRCGNRYASSSRRWTRCRRAQSWRKCQRS